MTKLIFSIINAILDSFQTKLYHVGKIMAPLGAIKAEAKAGEEGLQFAKDLSIQDFTLESDSQVLINALIETSPAPASVAADEA